MMYFLYSYRFGSATKDGVCAIKDGVVDPDKALMVSAAKASGESIRDMTYWAVTSRDHLISKVGEQELARIEAIAEGVD